MGKRVKLAIERIFPFETTVDNNDVDTGRLIIDFNRSGCTMHANGCRQVYVTHFFFTCFTFANTCRVLIKFELVRFRSEKCTQTHFRFHIGILIVNARIKNTRFRASTRVTNAL